ncbi:hypothetical protein E1N52_43570 [Paraburkholderia guartelaensis]|uniref:Uncharacterized protein n=1 Tax=Paraburkholderia guartelaensis TaxID=2546446 RepID=A0A4R5KJM0_9BURK|nr:hypothetical protein [Paraburkholderia guartelaensis]TDF95015.1 hypothetical protein E1N52_43570 [Paraburkholderia guartelaensis]
MKTGREYQKLRFGCGKIGEVYHTHVRGKLKDLFGGTKLGEAEKIFDQLATADVKDYGEKLSVADVADKLGIPDACGRTSCEGNSPLRSRTTEERVDGAR